jgi:glycosyltransferase involved in cell wall biosynthesis
MTEPLSAIVICKNEEKNIGRCLASLAFANEVILLDSGSTDNTLTIARTFPNVHIVEASWQGYVKNKELAISHTKNSWVLWLDADEEAPAELAQEWSKWAQTPKSAAPGEPTLQTIGGFLHTVGGFRMARRTFFLNHWVRHGGWYPGWIIRLFHKDRAKFSPAFLHESIGVDQGFATVTLKSEILHYSYTSLYQYFDKMNQYGQLGAEEVLRKKKNFFFLQILFQPLWTFFRFYVLKLGFLDGPVGLIVCMGAGFSNFIKYVNVYYLRKCGKTKF